jgi:hypothetical protein
VRPEPAAFFKGTVSDASEHTPMLDNTQANVAADAIAIEQALKIGFSREEAEAMCGGKTDLESIFKG